MNSSQQLKLVFLIIGCQLVISCTRPCQSIVEHSLDTFDSVETGARAAVQRLSQELHRCGDAKIYNIAWKFPAGEQERGWRALRYTRRDKTSGVVGYEYDPGSGTRGETYLVDDSAVDEVAKEGGALSDFAKYQKKKE